MGMTEPLRITLGNLLHDCARRYGDRPFLTIAETGATLSYAEFDTLTNRIAHGLRQHYPDTLGYVALLLENSAEYLATTYALKKLAAIEVSINPAMRGESLQRMIDQTHAALLFTSEQHLDALEQISDRLPHVDTLVMLDETASARERFPQWTVRHFDELLSDCADHIDSGARDTDIATILFTSGTTGVSKGCMLSHRYAVRTAENMIPPFRITSDDCNYTPYPLCHIGPAYYDILPTPQFLEPR